MGAAHAQSPQPQPEPPRRAPALGLRRAGPDSRVTLALGLWIVVGLACTAVWGLVGASGRWPVWVWLGAGAPVAVGAALRVAWRVRPGPARWAVAHAGLALVTSGALVLVWALTGMGSWVWWPLLGIAVAFAVHALLAFADRLPPRPRERALSARVNELERTRRGALDLQSAELRRVERDLHDGVQSRLVALAMLLGRAQERLEEDSGASDLLRQAREQAGAAVSEVRTLSHGLAPPLLVERGLTAAVEGLARRSPLVVRVESTLTRRHPPAVETAAYFVVAEALTNVLKHAPGAAARVSLATAGDRLVVEVADDGPGGADAAGSGLRGLRHRVEALDGELEVGTREAGGTVVHAELPCGS